MQSLSTMLRDLRKRKLPTSRGRIVGAVTQKKNNCLNLWVDGDTPGDIETKQPRRWKLVVISDMK